MPKASLFFNSSGPNTSLGSPDGIYISCQPTGSSEEETAVEYTKNTVSYDLSSILTNPNTLIAFQIIIGCIVFVLLFLFLNYVYTYLTSDAPKLPSFNMPKIHFKMR
jgi:preprotein translocase subunit SecY